MAYITTRFCYLCGKETTHTNTICDDCHEREEQQKLSAWMMQTTEEKLTDLHKRLLKIEEGNFKIR
jgi:hypothetical protein